jgi:hypothetical protein
VYLAEPGDCSPDCTHQKNVAQKRFRVALKTVMTNREVKNIWETARARRSSTRHSGTCSGPSGRTATPITGRYRPAPKPKPSSDR